MTDRSEIKMPPKSGVPGFDPARFIARFGGAGHSGLVGLRYVAHDVGSVELMIPYQPDLQVGPEPGVMADGAWVTLLDMAGTLAVWTRFGEFRPHATIDLRVNHLHPPRPGAEIVARAHCDPIASKIASVHGMVSNAPDHDIAMFLASYMFTE